MKDQLQTLNLAVFDMRIAMLNRDWALALKHAENLEAASTAVKRCLTEIVSNDKNHSRPNG